MNNDKVDVNDDGNDGNDDNDDVLVLPSAPSESSETTESNHGRAVTTIIQQNLLLGKTIKCTLDDGRTATGSLICIDRLRNLILKDVREERWVDSSVYYQGQQHPQQYQQSMCVVDDDDENTKNNDTTDDNNNNNKKNEKAERTTSSIITVKRHLNQAMIPGKHLIKVEIDKSLYDEMVVSSSSSSLTSSLSENKNQRLSS